MRKSMRVFWLVSLLVFVSGCSGYRHYEFPGETDPNREIISQEELNTGSLIRVTVKSGETYEGILAGIGPDYVEVLLPEGGGTVQTYFARDVRNMDVFKDVSPVASLGAAALVVGGLVGGYYLVNKDNHTAIRESAK